MDFENLPVVIVYGAIIFCFILTLNKINPTTTQKVVQEKKEMQENLTAQIKVQEESNKDLTAQIKVQEESIKDLTSQVEDLTNEIEQLVNFIYRLIAINEETRTLQVLNEEVQFLDKSLDALFLKTLLMKSELHTEIIDLCKSDHSCEQAILSQARQKSTEMHKQVELIEKQIRKLKEKIDFHTTIKEQMEKEIKILETVL